MTLLQHEREWLCPYDVYMLNGTGPVQCYLHISHFEMQCSGLAVMYAQLRGSICHVKLIWCSGVAWIYYQLTRGSICHVYMCILLYVKLIQCSGVAWISYRLTGGPSAMHIFAFCYM